MESAFNDGINQLLKNIERHESFQLQIYEALKIIITIIECKNGYVAQIIKKKPLISDENPEGYLFKQIAVYGSPDIDNSMENAVHLTSFKKSMYNREIVLINKHLENNNLPPGHPDLQNFIAIPIEYKGEYLGQIGLSNSSRPDGFTLIHINYFKSFFSIVGQLLMTEKIESERAQLLEEKEITKAKNMFMANVSHEIRTPLNSIMGCIDYLSEIKLSRASKEALEDMKQSSFNLLYLVNDILDISGLESDKMDIHLSPERISAITQAAYLVTKTSKPDGVTFTEHVDPKIPKFIVTDPQRVKQILINLLSNAFKFTEKGFVKLKISEPTKKDLFDLDLPPLNKVSMSPSRMHEKNPSEDCDDTIDMSIPTNHYSYRKGSMDLHGKGVKPYKSNFLYRTQVLEYDKKTSPSYLRAFHR